MRPVPLLATAPVLDDTGRLTHYVAIQHDVTSLVEAPAHKTAREIEEAVLDRTRALESTLVSVERRRRFAETILNSMVSAILTTDAGGRITFANLAALRTLGASVADCMGRSVVELFGHNEAVADVVAGGGPPHPEHRLDFPVTTPGGARIYLGVSIVHAPAEFRKEVGLIFMFRNLAETVLDEGDPRLRELGEAPSPSSRSGAEAAELGEGERASGSGAAATPPLDDDTAGEQDAAAPADVQAARRRVLLSLRYTEPAGLVRAVIDKLAAERAVDGPFNLNSGFQYHRARWMDPGAARFAGIETWEGDPYRPTSLHKYLYAAGGPVNNIDPSGRRSLGVTMVTLTINISLNAFSSFNPAAPVTSLATVLLTATAETFIPVRVPARILRTAWRYARPIGGIFKFSDAVRVGFKSPIAPYRLLVDLKKGQGAALQAHHILESRHLRNTFRWTEAQSLQAPAQILTQAEHIVINTQLTKKLPTGVVYTKRQIWAAYQAVYAKYPGYLAAIAHLF